MFNLINKTKNGFLQIKAVFLQPFNSRLSARARVQRQIPYIYYETKGGHTWRNWRLYLSEFLQFIFKDNTEVE